MSQVDMLRHSGQFWPFGPGEMSRTNQADTHVPPLAQQHKEQETIIGTLERSPTGRGKASSL